MGFRVEENEMERQALLYHSAAMALCNAICSAEDETTTDDYIRSCISSAVSDMYELCYGVTVEAALAGKTLSAGKLKDIAPLNELRRNELAVLAEQLERDLERGIRRNISCRGYDAMDSHMHAFVCCAC